VSNFPSSYVVSGTVAVSNLATAPYSDYLVAPAKGSTYQCTQNLSQAFAAPSATVQSTSTTIKARGSTAAFLAGIYAVEMSIYSPPIASTSTSGSIVLTGVLSIDGVNTTNVFTNIDGDFTSCTSLGSSTEAATFFKTLYVQAVPVLGTTSTQSVTRTFSGTIVILSTTGLNFGVVCGGSGTFSGSYYPVVNVNIRRIET